MTATHEQGRQAADRPAQSLDNTTDRDELRHRYHTLLEELRVLLPGVQVLLAFLITVPFANAFEHVDGLGRSVFGIALWSALLSVIAFVTPTVFHRFGGRRQRAERLQWGIRMQRVGVLFLAITLTCAAFVVSRFVFGSTVGILVTVSTVVAIGGLWVVLPASYRADDDR